MQTENIYLQRINTVIDYIYEHPAEDLSLSRLAQVACFSPFHFHRIFKALTGETVNQCVTRLRLESAAVLLKASPQLTITRAAFDCGFESASDFARTFKKRFGINARSWDRQSPLKNSKKGQVFKDFPPYTLSTLRETAQPDEFEVQVRALSAKRVAYIRVSNAYDLHQITAAYDHLATWFRARGGDPARTMPIGLLYDDPEITPPDLYRYDWCITVPPDWKSEGEVSVREFPACHIAYLHCQGNIDHINRGWQYLYDHWLPRSQYVPDLLPGMEIYRRLPEESGWEQFDLECAIPIVSL